jgi:hypothetical protein
VTGPESDVPDATNPYTLPVTGQGAVLSRQSFLKIAGVELKTANIKD